MGWLIPQEKAEEFERFYLSYKKTINTGMNGFVSCTGKMNQILSSHLFDNVPMLSEMMELVESMARSEDKLIGEVCDFTILEALNDEIEDEILIPLLGEQTAAVFQEIKQYMI